MRRVWVVLVLVPLLLVPAAGAQETLYGHTSADSLFMSLDPEDPEASGQVASGREGQDAVTWAFSLQPPATEIWRLDEGANVTATVGVGAASGFGQVDVSWTLASGGTLLARGEAREVLYTGQYVQESWDVALESAVHDPRSGPLWWNVSAEGTSTQIFLSVDGDDRSRVSLPVVAREPIVEEPVAEVRNVTGNRVQVLWDLPMPTTRWLVYHWPPPGSFDVEYNASLSAGTASARLADGDNTTRWEAQWPGTGAGDLRVRNATGDWTLELRFDDAQGLVRIELERVQTTSSTTRSERGSPAVGIGAGGLALAWVQVARRGRR